MTLINTINNKNNLLPENFCWIKKIQKLARFQGWLFMSLGITAQHSMKCSLLGQVKDFNRLNHIEDTRSPNR